MADHIAKFPVTLSLHANEQHKALDLATRQDVILLLTKFAMRLPDPSERGMLLLWLGELPDPLPHYNAIAAAGWRVSIQGQIGVDVQESLAC